MCLAGRPPNASLNPITPIGAREQRRFGGVVGPAQRCFCESGAAGELDAICGMQRLSDAKETRT